MGEGVPALLEKDLADATRPLKKDNKEGKHLQNGILVHQRKTTSRISGRNHSKLTTKTLSTNWVSYCGIW